MLSYTLFSLYHTRFYLLYGFCVFHRDIFSSREDFAAVEYNYPFRCWIYTTKIVN